jgi:hypothetical protein
MAEKIAGNFDSFPHGRFKMIMTCNKRTWDSGQ